MLGTTSNPSRRITESKLMCGPNSLKITLKNHFIFLNKLLQAGLGQGKKKSTPEEADNINNRKRSFSSFLLASVLLGFNEHARR